MNDPQLTHQPITLEAIVNDVLKSWPQTIPVFLKHCMGCVGCSMSAFERLGDALVYYAVPSATFIEELHLAIQGEATHE
jgi:hybrid cluster-associated redox disulfide protein